TARQAPAGILQRGIGRRPRPVRRRFLFSFSPFDKTLLPEQELLRLHQAGLRLTLVSTPKAAALDEGRRVMTKRIICAFAGIAAILVTSIRADEKKAGPKDNMPPDGFTAL